MASKGAGFEDKHTKDTKKGLEAWEHQEQYLKEEQAKKTAYEETIALYDFEKAYQARADRAYEYRS